MKNLGNPLTQNMKMIREEEFKEEEYDEEEILYKEEE